MMIQCAKEEYRIVSADGQEGDFADYGEPAVLKVGNDIYYACCDLDKDDEVTDAQVYRVDSISEVETSTEDVDVEDDEDEDLDEDEEEDEDEDESVTVS